MEALQTIYIKSLKEKLMLPFPIISHTPVLPKSEVVSYDAGNANFTFVSGNGDLYFYGYNSYGQFGNGTTNNTAPVWYKSNEMNNVARVFSNNSRCTVVIKKDNTVWACGQVQNSNMFGSVTMGTGVISSWVNITASIPVPVQNIKYIKPGYYASALLTNDGLLYWSGSNGYTMFGMSGGKTTYTLVPFSSSTPVLDVFFYGMYNQYDSSAIVDYNNKLYMAGSNSFKQIDNTTTSSYATYTASLPSYKIKKVYFGATASILAHTVDNNVIYSGISGVINASSANGALNGSSLGTYDLAGSAASYVYYGLTSTRACYAQANTNNVPITNTNNQNTLKTLVRYLPTAESGFLPDMFCTELRDSILFYKGSAGNNRLYALGALVGQGSTANAQYVQIKMPTGF